MSLPTPAEARRDQEKAVAAVASLGNASSQDTSSSLGEERRDSESDDTLSALGKAGQILQGVTPQTADDLV